jgi:hypothetical protein
MLIRGWHDRYGQPFPKPSAVSQSHPRAWGHRCNCLSLHRPYSHHDGSLPFPPASMGVAITHLASGPDCCVDDGPICAGMVCSWAESESDEPSPRDWAGDLCPCACTGDWGLVCAQSRERESEKQITVKIDGKPFTFSYILILNGTSIC